MKKKKPCPHVPKHNPLGATTCLKCTFPDGITMADLGNHIQEPKVEDHIIKEVCICAAIQLSDGTVFRGHRHSDCFRVAQDNGRSSGIAESEQGFITSRNRFVTREEGRKLQDAAGIPSANKLEGYMEGTLFPEDLY